MIVPTLETLTSIPAKFPPPVLGYQLPHNDSVVEPRTVSCDEISFSSAKTPLIVLLPRVLVAIDRGDQ